jgi:leader peptidase (prepilin peptidase)/N-methyltransferase
MDVVDQQTGVVGVALAGLAFAAAGAGGGAVARWLLARLRRGPRVRAPGCELALAAAWAATGAALAAGAVPGAWVPVLLGLGWLGVAAGAVDLRRHRLPDALTLPALPVALALLAPLGPGAVLRGVAGAAVAVAAHAALHLVAPAAMGAGDVKLAGSLGAVLAASSWSALALAAVLAAVLTGIAGVVAAARGTTAPGGGVAHGPSMLLAGWLVVAVAAVGGGPGGAG